MILDNEEADARLNNPNNLFLKIRETPREKLVEILPMPSGGRKEGDKAIPPRVRELLGSLAHETDDTQKEIASVFGVSQVTVSDASRGLIGDRLDEDLAEKVDLSKDKKEDKAHNLALDALVGSLGIVNDKIKEVDTPLKAARLASDMSKIVANLKGKEQPSAVSNVKVVLFAPSIKQETHYETAEV